MRVVQVINALDPTDAVSMHLLELDRQLRALGHETGIVSRYHDASLASHRRPPEDLASLRPDVILFHYAGFSPLLGTIAGVDAARGVVYQNVTPPHFFEGIPETHEFTRRGREQIEWLHRVFHFAIAPSSFNADELRARGFEHVTVVPIPWQTSGLDAVAPDGATLARRKGDSDRLLMAGRVAPHKGVHHAIAAMPEIRRRIPNARLTIVGRTSGYDAYVRKLRADVDRLGLSSSVEILGEVEPAVMRALFETTSALLVTSEHEGFCLPIAEAIGLGVPVVAAPAGAILETLGGAGVVVADRGANTIADGVERVLRDEGERSRIRAAAEHRRRELDRHVLRDRFASAVDAGAAFDSIAPDESLPSVSVVVCTYNRCAVLRKCLEGLRRLDYPTYEVVVVNGPSTDATELVLADFPDVKRVDNPARNLSISRNLGIAASAGEVVAFLDDDALPGPTWLSRIVPAYADPTVGGAGGRVIGPGGDNLHFDRGVISRAGMPDAVRDEPAYYNAPDAERYNILMGTNATFRRSALDGIGGFDENYEYYHDESDVCVRMIQNGWRIVHVGGAEVWHEFASSHVRKNMSDLNWRVIVKNTIYFYFKLNRWRKRPWDWVAPLRPCAVHAGIFTRWFVHGVIGPGAWLRALARFVTGLAEGYAKGWFVAPRRDLAKRTDRRRDRFAAYGRTIVRGGRDRMRICLVSQQYAPQECGGIGVYTEQLAEAFVDDGHQIVVVAEGARPSNVWREGVHIVRVPSEDPPGSIPRKYRRTRRNLGRSLAVDRAIRELTGSERVQIVEGPLWDAETFVTSIRRELPHVLRLVTPMAMALETSQSWRRNPDFDLAIEMEWELIRNADGVIDSSGTILETLDSRWRVRPTTDLVAAIPFGVSLPAIAEGGASRESGDAVRFLFVGRLEARKGIDVLVAAIPRVFERCPTAVFDVVGDHPTGRPREILDSIPVALRSQVRIHGWLGDAARDELYRQCDVFVAPSRYESFGLVYIEAMAYAKPCVACDEGGARTVVGHEVAGLLAPPGDAAALADALVRLARDPELRKGLGRRARARVEERYTATGMARATLDFYERVLSQPRRRAGARNAAVEVSEG